MQYLDHLAREFDRHFGRSLPAITPPDPVDELEAAEGVAALEPAPLTGLSLCRCSRYGVPHVPDNVERRRAFRDTLPVEIFNAIPWDHVRAREYAMAEMADAQDRETDPEFSFCYGANK